MDGQVARRADKELADLMDKFVCVRIIQGYGADLSLFQFDYQLTWSVFFLNADKTIYGRYGTRSETNALKDVSIDGFRKAVAAALALHSGYPKNKSALAAKTGAPGRWKTPEAMPALSKYKLGDTSRQGCIHCHKIQSGELESLRKAGEAPADRNLWVYPMPQTVGLTLDVNEMAMVRDVDAGSAAEKAGFKAGDKILALEKQPLISIADVQWVLHNAPESGPLKAEVERGGQTVQLALELTPGWRRKSEYTWRSVGWMLGHNVAGFRSELLPAVERTRLGLDGVLALRVKNIIPNWLKEGNHAVFKSGLAKGDVIVDVDGKNAAMTESEFLAYLAQTKKPADVLALTVLRGGQRVSVKLPLQ